MRRERSSAARVGRELGNRISPLTRLATKEVTVDDGQDGGHRFAKRIAHRDSGGDAIDSQTNRIDSGTSGEEHGPRKVKRLGADDRLLDRVDVSSALHGIQSPKTCVVVDDEPWANAVLDQPMPHRTSLIVGSRTSARDQNELDLARANEAQRG